MSTEDFRPPQRLNTGKHRRRRKRRKRHSYLVLRTQVIKKTDHVHPNGSERFFWSVRLDRRSRTQAKKKQEELQNFFCVPKKIIIIMIELFNVLFALTSVLSMVTCSIWCNRCILEWRIRRRMRRRNPAMFRKPSPATPVKHSADRPVIPKVTPEPENIYMEIDLEQPAPWDSVAPPPYTRIEATQISYI